MPKGRGKRHTAKEHRAHDKIARKGRVRNAWAVVMSMSRKSRGRRKKR
jgi:hypothetical protein